MNKLLKVVANESLQKELTDYIVKTLFEGLDSSAKHFFYHIDKDEYLKLSDEDRESKIDYYIADITGFANATWDLMENEVKGLLDEKNIPQEDWKNELNKYYRGWRKSLFNALTNGEFLRALKEKIDEVANEKTSLAQNKRVNRILRRMYKDAKM